MSQVPLRLLHTPLLVTAGVADAIVQLVSGTILNVAAETKRQAASTTEVARASAANGRQVAVIPIHGHLTYRGFGWFADTSYMDIRRSLYGAMQNPDIGAVLFDVDSTGGEAVGCFDLADEIYAARGQKPTIAFINSQALSGAYALASAAEKVVMLPDGEAGSVGVVAIHRDLSEMYQKAGIKVTPIYAGARKIDYAPFKPLTQKEVDTLQAGVDRTYGQFTALVARNRGMAAKAVQETQAAVYEGAEAVKIGLADEVATFAGAIDMAVELAARNTTPKPKGTAVMSDTPLTIEQLQENISTLLADQTRKPMAVALLAGLGFVPQAEQGTAPAEVEERVAQTRETTRTETIASVQEIAGLCQLANRPELTAKMIMDHGTDVEKARESIQAIQSGSQQQVVSTMGGLGSGSGESPLVADAKRRAEAAA